jgi:hypothetical protein
MRQPESVWLVDCVDAIEAINGVGHNAHLDAEQVGAETRSTWDWLGAAHVTRA